MTISEINTRINFLTNTSTTEYPAADRLININKWYNQVHAWILQAGDEWDYDDSNQTDFPTITTDLVANQQDYGGLGKEYVIKVKRAEITYDGSYWVKALPFDLNEDENALDTTSVSSDFSQEYPRYRLLNNSVLVYPIPTANVTGGLKLYIDRSVVEFTSGEVTTGTKVPGFDVNFHDILPLGASYDYLYARRGDKSLMQDILLLKQDLMKQYSKKVVDRKYAVTPAIENYS